jgi:hypothetical protein
MSLTIKGATSGSVDVVAPASGSDVTLTLPTTTGTVLLTNGDGSSLTGTADATKLPLSGGTLTNTLTVQNNVSSNTDPSLALSGTSNLSQDCYLQMAECWTSFPLAMGMDNSANAFKIARNSSGNLDSGVHLKIDSSGRVTMPNQPAFNAYGSTSMTNLTGTTTVNFNSEFFDQNSNFNTGTYTFTAPVTGKYQFNATLVLQSLDINHSGYGIVIETSNRNYVNQPIIDPAAFDQGPSEWTLHGSVFVDMDANDTALVKLYCAGGTNVDIYMAGQPRTLFSGFLVC